MKKYFVIFTALALISCSQQHPAKEFSKSVYVTTADNTENGSSIYFAGVIAENDNVSLGFKTAGQIEKIYVKEGDRVHKGQLLARLDTADYHLGVEALQIQYEQVKREVDRARRLFETKSLSANEYDKACAGLKQLAVQLQVNKNKLAYTSLYAPASGIIESVNFAPAEMVDAGTCVFNMLDTHALEVICDITAGAYAERGRFEDFEARTSGRSAEVIPLTLTGIVPKADSNQLYRMRLAVDGNGASALTPGMNVSVIVKLRSEGNGGLTLPQSAIFLHDGQPCVWIVEPDTTVSLRRISIAERLAGDRVTVLSGIAGNEPVVRAGVAALHQGEKVRIIDNPTPTNAGNQL